MKDATRDEVIQWCIGNKVDFTKPLFPPPEGWAWGDTGVPAKLLTALCPSDEMENVESVDIIFKLGSRRLAEQIIVMEDNEQPVTDEDIKLWAESLAKDITNQPTRKIK